MLNIKHFLKKSILITLIALISVFDISSTNSVFAQLVENEDGSISISINKLATKEENRMSFKGMLPGDSISKEYLIEVAFKDSATISLDLEGDDSKLLEVLKFEISDEDSVLYDGIINGESITLAKFTHDGKTNASCKIRIKAYLDTSVGNDYMNLATKVKFCFAIVEKQNAIIPSTGIDLTLPLIAAGGSAALIVIIILLKKRNKDGE